MGILTATSYIKATFPQAIRYYKPTQKIPGHFVVFALDSNPFVYGAVAKVFEPDAIIKEYDHLSYTEKIQLVYEYTFDEIHNLVQMVDAEQVFIAFDGPCPTAKGVQQRKRRYMRSVPEDGDFDTTLISCGTQFMHDLCGYIRFRLQKEWIKNSVQKVIFSSDTVPNEGEHKLIAYLRKLPPRSRVILMSPDSDLFMLGLLTNLSFFLFKEDYATKDTYEKKYYTIFLNCVKPVISKWTPNMHLVDSVKTFVFLGILLGNDFQCRAECLEIFVHGVDNIYSRYLKLGKPLFTQGRMDKRVFTELLYTLANEESSLLEKRTKEPFPLLEKHLIGGKLDFQNFRKEYYDTFLKGQDIAQVCYNYLDVWWWNHLYYTRGCPQYNFYYKYHYPPFLCDLAMYSRHWKIPFFKADIPRTPFQQLVAIIPPSRKHLVPEEYWHLFEDPELFPDTKDVVVNTQGRGEFEVIYELPIFDKQIDVIDTQKYARNRVDKDRVFTRGEQEYWVISKKYGEFITNVEG